jgi:hypothetical protein
VPPHLHPPSLQLYLTATIAALLAPAVVERMGAGRTMLVGSLGFPVYVASVTYIALPVVFATSIMMGFAG